MLRPSLSVVVAAALLALASCTSPPRAGAPQSQALPRPFPPSNGHAGAAWVPWAVLDLDARPRGAVGPADVEQGEGFALRAGRYDDSLGFEGVFVTTEHDERRTDAELTSYAGYVNLTDRWELWQGPVAAWAGIGFGMGLVHFDWDGPFRSETTGLWQGEGILALQIGRNVTIEARGSGFLAAHPTRTAGFGAMAMLGGTIIF